MCGSGTTLVVAARLDRRFIGGDASALANETASGRLDREGVTYRLAAAGRSPSDADGAVEGGTRETRNGRAATGERATRR
jgi:hypothetical protein